MSVSDFPRGWNWNVLKRFRSWTLEFTPSTFSLGTRFQSSGLIRKTLGVLCQGNLDERIVFILPSYFFAHYKIINNNKYFTVVFILTTIYSSLFQFNFVGRILGPRGMTAKQLEQDTGCKIMVRGKGSMRDKKKVSDIYPFKIWHVQFESHFGMTAFILNCYLLAVHRKLSTFCKSPLSQEIRVLTTEMIPFNESEYSNKGFLSPIFCFQVWTSLSNKTVREMHWYRLFTVENL